MTTERAVRTTRFRLPLIELGLVFVMAVAFVVVPLGVSAVLIWACLLVQYGLIVASVMRPVIICRGLPTYITAEFVFLFFSYLIFFYPYQLHVLGIYDVSRSAFFANTFVDQSNHGILLSSIGTVAFCAGLRAVAATKAEAEASPRRVSRLDHVTAQALAFPVFALQVFFIAVYLLSGWRAAGEGRYTGQVSGGPLAEGIYLVIVVLAMVSIALWILPAPKDETRRSVFLLLSVILSSMWSVRLLLSGDRNSFLLVAVVAVAGLLTFRVRAGRWVLAILCVVAVALYQAVEELRSGQINSLLDFFTGGGASNATYDGDTSFNISTIGVRAALASVPEHIDFGYGLYKIIGFAGIIPFIRGLIFPPDLTYIQSSDILDRVLLGNSPSWSVGSNIIVDIYVDFGFIAVPLCLFGLGLFVAYIQIVVARYPESPWRGVVYLMTLALVAEIPRYSLDFPVRPLVWVLLLFWVISSLSPSVNQHTRRADRFVDD